MNLPKRIDRLSVAKAGILDLNGDGIEDFDVIALGWIYSHGEEFFTMEPNRGPHSERDLDNWIFPPRNDRCAIKFEISVSPYLTTDGINYFWLNQCNITQLTGRN